MSKGEVAASIIVSVVLTLGLVYFVVPILMPTPVQPGTIRQIQKQTSNTQAVCFDTQTTWAEIPGMNLTIGVLGNSRLWVTMECPFHLEISSGTTAGTF